jgi:hypothetical protein
MLSKLQQWILAEAQKKQPDGRLYYAEIKARYYGLPVFKHAWWPTLEVALSGVGDHHFPAREIPSYAAVSAAISRAVSRLEKRGLVKVLTGANSRWTAVTTTQKVELI